VLRSGVLSSEAERRRFRHEALALSKLNHPNVAVVHDFDTSDGIDFLVMELVPGRSLRQKLAEGPLEEEEIVRLGGQLAEGLMAAHAKGITHRDLKPSNLRVTEDGRLKILDFGLAKVLRTEDSQATTDSLATGIYGTLPYMSPEQIRGAPADVRMDIYGAGAVIYEMACGQRPFEHSSPIDLAVDIMNRTPPSPRVMNSQISGYLGSICARALEKKPEHRYPTASALLGDLRRLGSRRARRRLWMVAVPLALLLLGTGVATRFLLPKEAQPVEASMTAVATWPGEKWDGRVSPDGSMVSFLADRDGKASVWVREAEGAEAQPLELRTMPIRTHAWSPDGRRLALVTLKGSQHFLQLVPAEGGSPERSWRLEIPFHSGRIVRWIGENLYLEVPGRGLSRFDLGTGELVHLLEGWPGGNLRAYFDVRADEQAVVYSLHRDDRWSIWRSDMEGGNPVLLAGEEAQAIVPRWLGTEAVLFTSTLSDQADLWRLDLTTGRRQQVTFSHQLEFAEDTSLPGDLTTYTELHNEADLWTVDLRGRSWTQITADTRQDLSPSVSRDGSRVAFLRATPGLAQFPAFYSVETQVGELSASGFRELHEVALHCAICSLSPDGRFLALVRVVDKKPRALGILEIDSGHEWPVSEAFHSSSFQPDPIEWLHRNLVWTPGSESLLFSATGEEEGYEIRRARPEAEAEAEILLRSEARPLDLLPSGDGRLLAYLLEGEGEPRYLEVRVRDLETGEDRLLRREELPDGWRGNLRGWTPGAEGLWMLRSTLNERLSDHIEVLELDLQGQAREVATIEGGFVGTARIDQEGRRLFLTIQDESSRAHDLCELDLETGSLERLARNRLPGVTYTATEVVDESTLLCSRHSRRKSIWLIRFDR
jgi:Tol biopolymer transport system component